MEKINIRPQVNILAMLKHLEYHAWYAIAEFVDNAIGSYQRDRDKLFEINPKYRLIVSVEIDDDSKTIVIRDNAGGIPESDFSRALRAAEIPPDNSGLSEFGMGMKSAACWFTSRWSVRSSAVGESECRIVHFDLKDILVNKHEEIPIEKKPESSTNHYTVITLQEIERMPVKRTKGKIKSHLASIYRQFLRSGELELIFDGEPMKFDGPRVLNAERVSGTSLQKFLWKKDVDITLSDNLKRVHGFVALRETMSNTETGFALFRRGRVIEGSGEDGFRPREIMGDIGSPEFKRIFGELHFEGFEVSFTKKGIQWNETLEEFLEKLKRELTDPEFNLLKQAKEYRVKPSRQELLTQGQKALDATAKEIGAMLQDGFEDVRRGANLETTPEELSAKQDSYRRDFDLDFKNSHWHVSMEVSFDPSLTDWLEVGSRYLDNSGAPAGGRRVGIRVFLGHPFVQNYLEDNPKMLEMLLRIAASIGLAEEASRESGVKGCGSIRRNINKILEIFSNNK